MAIDYKRELESAAKNMILVHEPETLIRMTTRLMVQKVNVIHSAFLVYDNLRNTYVLRFSRGPTGIKIPRDFVRMDQDNPLIRFLKEAKNRHVFKDGLITQTAAQQLVKRTSEPKTGQIINGILEQMRVLNAAVCIPCYFRKDLLGVLFLGKKRDGQDFNSKELDFFAALTSDLAMAIRNARLFNQLQHELDKRQQLFINTAVALAAAIEAKDHYTIGHTQRVIDLSLRIGEKIITMRDGSVHEKFLEQLHIAALLHDIGKIGISEIILNKKGVLTEEEWHKMKQHPIIGANILHSIQELEQATEGVRYHHERYDGKGYPEGLSYDQIPLIAAIIAVADTFDAITTDRPYCKAKSRRVAISEIKQEAGRQLHPQVVSAFLQLCEESEA